MTRNFYVSRKKYFFVIISIFAILFFCTKSLYATELNNENNTQNLLNFDIDISEELYKFSEHDNVYLPFLRVSQDRVLIDNEVKNAGIVYGEKGIEVNSKTENIQVLLSSDTIRVNNSMEYAIIGTLGNVIIDSNIDKTLIVFADEKVTITENAKISGDVICFSNSLDVKGNVLGSVVGVSNTSIVSGKIEKDFRIRTGYVDILSKDNILGNVYIETKNEDINIEDKYPEATINLVEEIEAQNSLWNIIIGAIKTALVYTLAYILIFKISKEKLIENVFSVAKKNVGYSFISGALSILVMPIVIMLILFSVFIGIEEILVPLLLFYSITVIVIGLLSTFIISCMAHEYIIQNYFLNCELTKRLVCAFFVFLSMILISKIPVVGLYVNMIYCIVSLGIVFSLLFKREPINKKKKN